MRLGFKDLKLIDIETLPKDGVKLPNNLKDFVWYFVKQAQKPLLLIFLLHGIVSSLGALSPIFIGKITDALTIAPLNFGDVLNLALLLLLIIYILQPFFNLVVSYLFLVCFKGYFREMVRYQLVHYTKGHSLEYFQNDFAGRLANKTKDVAHSIAELTMHCLWSIWPFFVTLVTTAIMYSTAHYLIAIALFAWLIVYGLVLYFVIPKIKAKSADFSDEFSASQGYVVDKITNILSVKLFAKSKAEDKTMLDKLDLLARKRRYLGISLWHMNVALTLLSLLLFLAVGGTALYIKYLDKITAGELIMVFASFSWLVSFLWWVGDAFTQIFIHLGTLEDGMKTIAKPHSLIDEIEAKDLQVTKGEIDFSNVNFHYGKSLGVVENLNLYIKPGQKIGLVGRSGAGKSTILNLLLRFYDVENGTIKIDGQDVAKVKQGSLRRNIAYVTQEPMLFHRSIYDNIVYAKPNAKKAEVIAAAKKANAHKFIQTLTDKNGNTGYNVMVGERGVKLSGGQRQRIAIARIILQNAPILLLDEATSALDSEVEQYIQEELVQIMKGKTVIAIAHRLSTIQKMDRIIVLDKGEVVQDGSHTNLSNKDGIYKSLWDKQSGGFLKG